MDGFLDGTTELPFGPCVVNVAINAVMVVGNVASVCLVGCTSTGTDTVTDTGAGTATGTDTGNDSGVVAGAATATATDATDFLVKYYGQATG